MSVFGNTEHPISEGDIRQMVKDKEIDLLSVNMLNTMKADTIDLLEYHAGHYFEVGDEEFDEVRLLKATLDEVEFQLKQREANAKYLGDQIERRYDHYIRERIGESA